MPGAPPTNEVEARKSENISFRTTPRIKRLIGRAASASGVSASTFVIDSATQAALTIIEKHERTLLEQSDHPTFFGALDYPPEPNDRLRRAFVRHGRQFPSG
jgi:uncharacterized protein (DUF1778 family)